MSVPTFMQELVADLKVECPACHGICGPEGSSLCVKCGGRGVVEPAQAATGYVKGNDSSVPPLGVCGMAPAASPPAVPAEVMEAAELIQSTRIKDQWENDYSDAAKLLARYVRESASGAASPPVCPDCNGTGKVPDSSGWCDCGCKRKAASPPAGLPPCECCEGKGTGYYIGRKWVCGHCDGSGKAAPLPPPGEPGVYDAATCEAIGDLLRSMGQGWLSNEIDKRAGQHLPAVGGKP